MATRTINMKKAREVIRLKNLNKSLKNTEAITGVSRTSIRYILSKCDESKLELIEIFKLNDLELKAIIYPEKINLDPRYLRLKSIISNILTDLGKRNENLLHQWEIYKSNDPLGYSYSQFCSHILKEQAKDSPGEAVFQYSFGDILFIDYAGDTISYCGLDDVEIPVKVFVSILPASQYVYAGLSLRATTADWVEHTTRAFEYFGGVPKAVVPDCDTAVVKKASKYQSELNHQFNRLSEHYDTTVVPARPYSPRDKALVENAVNNIYRYIYPRLRDKRCYSLDELEEYFQELLEKFNNRIMRRFQRSRLELFTENEKSVLQSLPDARYKFQKYQTARKIGNTSHIYLKEDQHYYSVPYRFISKKCEIYYTERIINVFCDNENICRHLRNKKIGSYTTNANHLSPRLMNYFKWVPETAIDEAAQYGAEAVTVVENIYKSQTHHLQARKNVYGVFSLAKRHGEKRFKLACKMMSREGISNYLTLKKILEQGLEKEEKEQLAFECPMITHSNIRYE